MHAVEIGLVALVLLIVVGCIIDVIRGKSERELRTRASAAAKGNAALDAKDRLALRGLLKKLRC